MLFTYTPSDPWEYKAATANFQQQTVQKASNLKATFLPNGYFLFHWDDSNTRKMVLTSNEGSHLSDGSVTISSIVGDSWTDTHTWRHRVKLYTLTNFTRYLPGL